MSFKITLVLLISIAIASGQLNTGLMRALFGDSSNIAGTAVNDISVLIDQILEAAGQLPRNVGRTANTASTIVHDVAGTSDRIVGQTLGVVDRLARDLPIRLEDTADIVAEGASSQANNLLDSTYGKTDEVLKDVGGVVTTSVDKSANTAGIIVVDVAKKVSKLLDLIRGLHVVVDDTARTADV